MESESKTHLVFARAIRFLNFFAKIGDFRSLKRIIRSGGSVTFKRADLKPRFMRRLGGLFSADTGVADPFYEGAFHSQQRFQRLLKTRIFTLPVILLGGSNIACLLYFS